MDLRRVIRGLGKALISIGILLFLFVGYQLWGTGIAEARGQRDLEKKFAQRALLTSVPTIPSPSGGPATTTTLPPIDLGDSVAMIEIPKIDLKKFVIEGVDVEDLKAGPGHYPGTPLPGEKGNAAIAGHRTTYGAPFSDLDDLSAGDQIFVTTGAGRFQYDVT
ncbi:MAG: sortase, partial [Acidimicrobiales bacterium]